MRLESRSGRTIDGYTAVVQGEPVDTRSVRIETQAGVTRVVMIGDEAWLARPAEGFAPVSLPEAEAQAQAMDVSAVLRPYLLPEVGAALMFVGRDARNGYEAAHYQADTALLREAFPEAGTDASLEVWTTGEGYLIALEAVNLESDDRRVTLDIERIGDPSIVVEPPPGF